MFPRRLFPGRFFAARYFPPVSGEVITTPQGRPPRIVSATPLPLTIRAR